jgi:hypothetical protein
MILIDGNLRADEIHTVVNFATWWEKIKASITECEGYIDNDNVLDLVQLLEPTLPPGFVPKRFPKHMLPYLLTR